MNYLILNLKLFLYLNKNYIIILYNIFLLLIIQRLIFKVNLFIIIFDNNDFLIKIKSKKII